MTATTAPTECPDCGIRRDAAGTLDTTYGPAFGDTGHYEGCDAVVILAALRSANPLNGILRMYPESRIYFKMLDRQLVWADEDDDLFLDTLGYEALRVAGSAR